jgi:hypothetical protein
MNVGFQFENKSSQVIRMLDARLTGVPRNVDVVGIYAINVCEGSFHAGLGAAPGTLTTIGLQPHPVTAYISKPGADLWYLIASVRGHSLGTFDTRGIRVTYLAGRKKYTQDFSGSIELIVQGSSSPEAHAGATVPGRRDLATTPPPACSKQ